MPVDDLTSSDERTASSEIVMFFLGPDGEPLAEAPVTAPRTLGDVLRAWRSTLDEERLHDGVHRPMSSAGSRPVQGTGRPGRHGFRDEIVVTLRSRPIDAVHEALRGNLFEPPLRWLQVDAASLSASRYELTWRATITERAGRSRAARLRLYASPSLNVTVLSLFPDRPRAVARRRFLRRGLQVMNALCDRIDERVDEGGCVGAGAAAVATC